MVIYRSGKTETNIEPQFLIQKNKFDNYMTRNIIKMIKLKDENEAQKLKDDLLEVSNHEETKKHIKKETQPILTQLSTFLKQQRNQMQNEIISMGLEYFRISYFTLI